MRYEEFNLDLPERYWQLARERKIPRLEFGYMATILRGENGSFYASAKLATEMSKLLLLWEVYTGVGPSGWIKFDGYIFVPVQWIKERFPRAIEAHALLDDAISRIKANRPMDGAHNWLGRW